MKYMYGRIWAYLLCNYFQKQILGRRNWWFLDGQHCWLRMMCSTFFHNLTFPPTKEKDPTNFTTALTSSLSLSPLGLHTITHHCSSLVVLLAPFPPSTNKHKATRFFKISKQSCPFMSTVFFFSSVHGILQVRILEWVAIPFSMGSTWPRDWTKVSCIAGRFFTVSIICGGRGRLMKSSL